MRTSVLVTLPIGEASFSSCTVDEFSIGGTLEVTACGAPLEGLTMRTYGPGEWDHATVYDDQGYPLYWFDAPKVKP